MNYIRVRWLHENPEAPVLVVSELDDHRWERRKVEVFADGSKAMRWRARSAVERVWDLSRCPLSMKSPPTHSSSPRKLPSRNLKRSGAVAAKLENILVIGESFDETRRSIGRGGASAPVRRAFRRGQAAPRHGVAGESRGVLGRGSRSHRHFRRDQQRPAAEPHADPPTAHVAVALRVFARRGGAHGRRPRAPAQPRHKCAGLRRLPFDEFRRLPLAGRQCAVRHQ